MQNWGEDGPVDIERMDDRSYIGMSVVVGRNAKTTTKD